MNTDAERPTPETDAITPRHSFTQFVPADFARKLERQRDEFADRLNNPVRCHSGHERLPLALWDCPDCVQKIREENTELRRMNSECSRLASIEADSKHKAMNLSDTLAKALEQCMKASMGYIKFDRLVEMECAHALAQWKATGRDFPPKLDHKKTFLPKAEGPCHLCGAPNYACEHIPGVPF